MLYRLILQKAQEWLTSEGCTIRPLLDYINANGNFREAQVQALLVYLFLKIAGGNKRLGTLFAEGFFARPEDLSSLNINQAARAVFEANPAARALFDLSRTPLNGPTNGNGHGKKNQKTLFPDLEKYLVAHPQETDYLSISKKLFYSRVEQLLPTL
ncbi:MAG: hypothetical protein K0B01_08625 [Syntrophobacterales bacterium]|nr:hypothetical protein [Syntrophobacterales bacterium]